MFFLNKKVVYKTAALSTGFMRLENFFSVYVFGIRFICVKIIMEVTLAFL